MRLPDVIVLVHAVNLASLAHARAQRRLFDTIDSGTGLGQEHGPVVGTFDRDFSRFDGVRVDWLGAP